MSVLICAASRHGATRALALAEALADEGLRVAAKPPEEVFDLEGCGALVLGSAVHLGHWLPSAKDLAERIGGRLEGMPVLLLTTTGRRSGRRRTVPLTYFEDGDALVVVGSKGGSPRHPDWYLNLLADPAVEAQVGSEHRRLRARRATEDEAARIWPVVVARWPGYARYRAKTSREIPLVLLSD